jgi:50S ribosomal subunit-associated GTPase HflX
VSHELTVDDVMSCDAVFVNTPRLSSSQVKGLEAAWKVPVFDRFGVVLRIFRERAVTREAQLQVLKADIAYMKTRSACAVFCFGVL